MMLNKRLTANVCRSLVTKDVTANTIDKIKNTKLQSFMIVDLLCWYEQK